MYLVLRTPNKGGQTPKGLPVSTVERRAWNCIPHRTISNKLLSVLLLLQGAPRCPAVPPTHPQEGPGQGWRSRHPCAGSCSRRAGGEGLAGAPPRAGLDATVKDSEDSCEGTGLERARADWRSPARRPRLGASACPPAPRIPPACASAPAARPLGRLTAAAAPWTGFTHLGPWESSQRRRDAGAAPPRRVRRGPGATADEGQRGGGGPEGAGRAEVPGSRRGGGPQASRPTRPTGERGVGPAPRARAAPPPSPRRSPLSLRPPRPVSRQRPT